LRIAPSIALRLIGRPGVLHLARFGRRQVPGLSKMLYELQRLLAGHTSSSRLVGGEYGEGCAIAATGHRSPQTGY
jgi:hypothetical protein